PPKGPTGLAAGAATGSSVPLTWADNANNEAGYAVDRATDAAFTQNVVTDATLAANATGHTATGLTAGTTYYFRVRAINAAGSSVPSNVVSVTPVAAATDLVETLLVPSDGQTVSTAAVLASGTQYWLRAIGYVYIGGQYGDRAADADWIRWPDPTYTTDVHPTGDDLGVRVVGSSLKWGPYSAEHVYTQTYAGTGSPLGAFFKDLPDSYADNLPGHIAVQVWRQPPPAYAPAVFVTATDPAAAEVPAGQPQNPGRFTLTRVGTPSVPLTVNYTVAGTASPGADYAALSGSVTFAAWATTATVDVTVTDDTTAEAAETVVLTVVQPAGHAPAGPTSATVTIADNDGGTTPPPVPLVTISPATATVNEAGQTSATFTVTRNVVTSEALAVTFAVDPAAIDPAEAGDYAVLPTGTTITILAGQPSATITLTAQQDADADDERLVLRLVDAAAYDLGTPFQAAVTINDSGGTSPGGPSVDLDLFEDTNGDGVHDNGAAAEAAEASQPTALPREGDDVDMAELALVVSGAAADATVSFGYATSELRLYRDLMALNPVTPGQVISLADLGISGSGTVAVFAAHTGGGTTTVVAAAGIAVTMGGTSPATSTALAGGTTAAPPPSPGDPALQDDVPDNYGGLDDGDGTQPLTDRDGFWDPGKNFGARTLRASNKTPPSAAATSRSSRTAA
ncbi:MAG TPA: DUF1735 domain-containing protein, partial [Tepidisphaeraceae bacterium]|nr:DUF1735 domain-containing protein [Tepidisphaeraceae bacterium]